MPEPIVLYDIPGNAHKDKAWSPNVWKTRYTLNIKGLPYRTVWVEAPDIASLCKKIGAPHTSTNPDGTPHYTLPTIYDPNTGKAVAESAVIARYLDKTYPSTPVLFPQGTGALHEAFAHAFTSAFLLQALQVGVARSSAQLNPPSAEHFRRQNGEAMLAPATTEERARRLKGLRDALHLFKGWLEADGSEKLFFTGETISYADVTIAAWLQWLKRVQGEDGQEWKEILDWDGGHWARFMYEFEKYEAVDVGSDAEL